MILNIIFSLHVVVEVDVVVLVVVGVVVVVLVVLVVVVEVVVVSLPQQHFLPSVVSTTIISRLGLHIKSGENVVRDHFWGVTPSSCIAQSAGHSGGKSIVEAPFDGSQQILLRYLLSSSIFVD